MPRKNIALEISLIVTALVGAFVIQAIVSQTKPPELPESATTEAVEASQVGGVYSEAVEVSNESLVPHDYQINLSDLGLEPDWSELDGFQYVISRDEFERLLSEVYTVGAYWKHWIQIKDDHAAIRMRADDPSQVYVLTFRNAIEYHEPETQWRGKSQMITANSELPLMGVKIAIDPGHIGGDYAQLEERSFILSEGAPPVQEGNMTLLVAELLAMQLGQLGAEVSLLREENEAVNRLRPEDYLEYAKDKLEKLGAMVSEETVVREATKLFYRSGEIRARAKLANDLLKPDIVLCIHFNAAAQKDPDNPELVENEHFHMLVNGAYTAGELEHDDERFLMVRKIVEGVHAEEKELAKHAAESFVSETALPAYQYAVDSRRAVQVDQHPYVWARNLLANRLYACPVLFYEPYLMNGRDSYTRMQVGDYEGLRYVNQKLRPSIYREYVNAVTRGLVNYYTERSASPEQLLDADLNADLEVEE